MQPSSGRFIGLCLVALGLCWAAPLQATGETDAASHNRLAAPGSLALQSDPAPESSSADGDKDRFGQSALIGPATKRHFATFALGAVYWPKLADVDPSQAGFNPEQFGRFEQWGYNFEIAYHYLATTLLERDLWIGFDFGLFYNENKGTATAVILPSGEIITGDIGSRGLYLTPSLKWFVLGQRGSTRISLGAGAGYYMLDFAELFGWGTGGELYEDSTLGGYVSVGVRFPFADNPSDSAAVVLETKIHFADFGEFAPNTGQIKGPIYLFQVGISF
ncbi:MAG: hypothetical protein AMJ54_09700 [Deltaproteobacteria bacterium SG8_13]|nr:MAG: hypothetical protein AMJ54_09700 [Deltaproteobacteria bacterium SG8_13]